MVGGAACGHPRLTKPMPSGGRAHSTRAIGVLGGHRSDVDPAGRIVHNGREDLVWWVQAEDSLHDPATSPTVRQRLLGGVPVVETRVRVPDGDVVSVAYAAADRGGADVVAFTNESPRAVAVIVQGSRIEGLRSATAAPRELGLGDARVIPLAHSATAVVGVPRSGSIGDPSTLPDAATVASGWRSRCERAGRVVLPPGPGGHRRVAELTEHRCRVLLDGLPDPTGEPVDHLLAVDQIVRMGEPAGPLIGDVVTAIERSVRRRHALSAQALAATRRVLSAAGEVRALGDLERLAARTSGRPLRDGGSMAEATRLEWSLVAPLEDRTELFIDGYDEHWLGQSVEVHDLPTAHGATVSFALRWHGARPALLWECSEPGPRLTASTVDATFDTTEPSGEVLLAAPAVAET